MSKSKFSQKYTIVCLFDSLADGFNYSYNNWPPHVTLADVFAVTINEAQLLGLLQDLVTTTNSTNTVIIGDEWFGENKDVHVKLLENTTELQSIHESIVTKLGDSGAIFNNPVYNWGGFRPHSTVQTGKTLTIGDIVTVDSLSLIDMFPKGDPYMRKVVKTFNLKK